jgi:hypothetical protein
MKLILDENDLMEMNFDEDLMDDVLFNLPENVDVEIDL